MEAQSGDGIVKMDHGAIMADAVGIAYSVWVGVVRLVDGGKSGVQIGGVGLPGGGGDEGGTEEGQ